jgi:hypothetical protein
MATTGSVDNEIVVEGMALQVPCPACGAGVPYECISHDGVGSRITGAVHFGRWRLLAELLQSSNADLGQRKATP